MKALIVVAGLLMFFYALSMPGVPADAEVSLGQGVAYMTGLLFGAHGLIDLIDWAFNDAR